MPLPEGHEDILRLEHPRACGAHWSFPGGRRAGAGPRVLPDDLHAPERRAEGGSARRAAEAQHDLRVRRALSLRDRLRHGQGGRRGPAPQPARGQARRDRHDRPRGRRERPHHAAGSRQGLPRKEAGRDPLRRGGPGQQVRPRPGRGPRGMGGGGERGPRQARGGGFPLGRLPLLAQVQAQAEHLHPGVLAVRERHLRLA
mmetsp:Transcript_37162/g.115644  ORF Transcript_37162/g.115644 Transcript_37162/m.115644 type:complete len:200 (+) Transcript_37162:488-1087(+)